MKFRELQNKTVIKFIRTHIFVTLRKNETTLSPAPRCPALPWPSQTSPKVHPGPDALSIAL